MSGRESGGELTFVGREFCSSGDCVEVARASDGHVVLRSSLAPHAPLFDLTADEWVQFLDSVKAGHFDAV